MRIFLILIGTISVVTGITGIFLPLLPTTPFLLLGTACYVRSSPKLYKRLIENKYLGTYIKNYREIRGIPFKTKVISITFLWGTIVLSAIRIDITHWRVFLFIVAAGVTIHIIKLKTLSSKGTKKRSL